VILPNDRCKTVAPASALGLIPEITRESRVSGLMGKDHCGAFYATVRKDLAFDYNSHLIVSPFTVTF
jgi:hypothetical protein